MRTLLPLNLKRNGESSIAGELAALKDNGLRRPSQPAHKKGTEQVWHN